MAKETATDPDPKGGGQTSQRDQTLYTYTVTDDAPAPAAEPVWIAVHEVERKGKVALVEWTEGVSSPGDRHRAYLPVTELTPRGVTAEALAAGEPYGVRWEDMIEPATPQALARALRQQGIWTVSDLAMRMGDAVQAMNRAALESLRRAIRAAKE